MSRTKVQSFYVQSPRNGNTFSTEDMVSYHLYETAEGQTNRNYRKVLLKLARYISGILPPKQRQCYTMYYYENLSVSEIAEVMRIKEKAVYANIEKARKNIEKYRDGLYQLVMECVEIMKQNEDR